MTDAVRAWIDARRTIRAAATKGTWHAGDRWVYTMPIYADDNRLCNVFGMTYANVERRDDERTRGQLNTEAIVDAHNTFPAALLALEVVLGVLEAGVRDGDDAETIATVALAEIAEALEGVIDGE